MHLKRQSFLLVIALLICLCPWSVQAATATQKPSLRLDVRSDKQAVLIITDPNMTQAAQSIRYDVRIGGYKIRMNWDVVDAGAIQGGGSIGYHEPSDNSQAVMGPIEYPDGCIAVKAERLDDTTLELWLDLSRDGLDVRADESPRDLTHKLRNIDFTVLTDEAVLTAYYDEVPSPEYRYTAEDYRYRNKWGLVFVLNYPSYGFDIFHDFGRCAGLSWQEIEQLYLIPQTDNYLVTHQRQGTTDVYNIFCFDNQGLIVGRRELQMYDNDEDSFANFNKAQTDPNFAVRLERFVGFSTSNEGEKPCNLLIYSPYTIQELRDKRLIKSSLLTILPKDTKVIKNSDGEVQP